MLEFKSLKTNYLNNISIIKGVVSLSDDGKFMIVSGINSE